MERGMPEQFKMTAELMDQIIFGMENQKEDLLLDGDSGLVVPRSTLSKEELTLEERYLDLPEWTPTDGFHLMEGFASALKNPIYRERLRDILNSGRGVFRGFKNVLKERPDLEKKWFLYKERLMKQRVREWYSELSAYWDALDAGDEPVETEDLFLEEFSILDISGSDPVLLEYRRDFFSEVYKSCPENLRKLMVRQADWRNRHPDFALKAVTAEGLISGVINGFIDESDDEFFLFIDSLYVLPEFRGAGVASGLIDRAAEESFRKGISRIVFTLPPEGDVMLENLKRKGFKPFRTALSLNVSRWHYETVQ
jgi:GNAT superfamily N-acetyltransferase